MRRMQRFTRSSLPYRQLSSHHHHTTMVLICRVKTWLYLRYWRWPGKKLYTNHLTRLREWITYLARPREWMIHLVRTSNQEGLDSSCEAHLRRPRGKNLSTKSSNSPTRSSQEASHAWEQNNQISQRVLQDLSSSCAINLKSILSNKSIIISTCVKLLLSAARTLATSRWPASYCRRMCWATNNSPSASLSSASQLSIVIITIFIVLSNKQFTICIN